MKLNHLTFGQLHKLASVQTLMRVERAYYVALRTAWEEHPRGGAEFSVSLAAELCPWVKRRYAGVIQFLRSAELKSALRAAAKPVQIPPSCCVSKLRVLESRRFINRKIRWALGALIVTHCKNNGVPACLEEVGDLCDFVVYAATDELGCAVLENKPGLKWETIVQFCSEMNVDASPVFWWLPYTDDKTGWRINPLLWPVNIPDYPEIAKQLVW